jgi:hypothetical protein
MHLTMELDSSLVFFITIIAIVLSFIAMKGSNKAARAALPLTTARNVVITGVTHYLIADRMCKRKYRLIVFTHVIRLDTRTRHSVGRGIFEGRRQCPD